MARQHEAGRLKKNKNPLSTDPRQKLKLGWKPMKYMEIHWKYHIWGDEHPVISWLQTPALLVFTSGPYSTRVSREKLRRSSSFLDEMWKIYWSRGLFRSLSRLVTEHHAAGCKLLEKRRRPSVGCVWNWGIQPIPCEVAFYWGKSMINPLEFDPIFRETQ